MSCASHRNTVDRPVGNSDLRWVARQLKDMRIEARSSIREHHPAPSFVLLNFEPRGADCLAEADGQMIQVSRVFNVVLCGDTLKTSFSVLISEAIRFRVVTTMPQRWDLGPQGNLTPSHGVTISL